MNWLAAALDASPPATRRCWSRSRRPRAPRRAKSGAKMLVRERDIVGSVGGGQLELLAIDEARRMMADKAARPGLMRYSLGPDLGQCCGGAVRLLLEPLTKIDRRWLTQWQSQRVRRGHAPADHRQRRRARAGPTRTMARTERTSSRTASAGR